MSAPPQETNDSVSLLVISQRGHLHDKLLTHFSETPAISLLKEWVNSLALIPGRLEQLHPDVLLVDTALSSPAVAEWLHAIRKKDAKVKIILLYDDVIPDLNNEIVEFGISGLIKIDASPDMYSKAIRTVHLGELWLPHLLISQIIAIFSAQGPFLSRKALIDLPSIINASSLTQRELCIIKLVAQGLTNKQIAKEFALSPETIKKHLQNIFEKSGVHSRCQLASMFGTSDNDNQT